MTSPQAPTTGTSPTILISGATGNIGTELTKHLAVRGVPFRAMVRNPDEKSAQGLRDLSGAELVAADFNDPASVGRALTGIERAFLLTHSSAQAEAQQLSFVEQARQAGVRHLIKQSQWAASAESPVRFLRYHAVVEQAIEDSGLAYTFLRPNLFMQGLLAFKQSIQTQGQLFCPHRGKRKLAWWTCATSPRRQRRPSPNRGHANKTYNLTGPQALTHREMAAELSAALHRPVAFVDVGPAELLAFLRKMGMDTWMAEGLVEDYAHYHRGEAAEVALGVQEATGQPPRSFATFAHDYAPVFNDDSPGH